MDERHFGALKGKTMLTKKDLEKVYGIVREAITFEVDPIRADLKAVQSTLAQIQNTMDKMLSLYKGHDDEISVLRARQNKMRTVLVQKGGAQKKNSPWGKGLEKA